MKKTLRSILAGALALLTVSCYDDTALRTEMSDLSDRVAAIEATLNAEVGGINDLIARLAAAEGDITSVEGQLAALEGKVAAIKVETKDGVTTLTLSDNSKVVLSKNGALTIVDGGWATVDADGKVTPLGIPVGHPKLAFRVTNGVLEVTYDGKTYESTGVKISEYTAHVIGSVVPSADGKTVTVTIGDQTITLALAAGESTLALSSQKMFVGYGLTKTFTVTGAEDFYVASKPDGWKVTKDGNTVTVAAPSKAAAQLGVIESEGEIVIHADADKCAYASLKVSCGDAFSLKIDTANATLDIFNALTIEMAGEMGDSRVSFGDALIGILPVSDYQYFTSVDELIEAGENWAIPAGYLNNIKENNELGGLFVAGEYEEDKYTIDLATLGASFYPRVELEEGVHYVVWAVPQTDKLLKDLAVVEFYKPIKISLEEKAKSISDITVDLKCSGASAYYAAAYPKSMFEYMTFEEFMEFGYMGVGAWKEFQMTGAVEAMGTPVEAGELNLSTLQYGDPLSPNTEYLVYVFPVEEGKAPESYVMETDLLPYVFNFTTAGLVEGGAPATLALNTAKTDYSSITVDVTVPEGTTAYYEFFEVGGADEYDDAALAARVMEYCFNPLAESASVKKTYLSAGQRMELVVVTVDAEGKYAIERGFYSTLQYPYNEAITVTLDSATLNAETGEYTVVYNVTGATKLAAYSYYGSTANAMPGNVLKYGLAASYTTYMWADVVDGKATIVIKPRSASYDYLLVSAYNVSADAVTDLSTVVATQLSTSVAQ